MAHDNTDIIERVLWDLNYRATSRGKRLPKVASVTQGPASEFTEHRAHAYCQQAPTGRGGTRGGELSIVYAPKLATSRWRRVTGVLAHEYGHAVLLEAGIQDHSERDADRAAYELFGIKIHYDLADIQTIADTPTVSQVRPGRLPK
jgi:hypothetical protein